MRVIINNNYSEICNWVAIYIKNAIKNHKKTTPFVLGLPTGSTPIGVYKLLIQYCKKGELSFKNVVTFNMDEYVGLSHKHKQSYHYFMHHNLFNHIDIPKENVHLLDGLAENLELECGKPDQHQTVAKSDLSKPTATIVTRICALHSHAQHPTENP